MLSNVYNSHSAKQMLHIRFSNFEAFVGAVVFILAQVIYRNDPFSVDNLVYNSNLTSISLRILMTQKLRNTGFHMHT